MQYEEAPNVRAVYDITSSPSKCVVNPKVLLDVFMNFPTQLSHVSLFFEPHSFKLKSVPDYSNSCTKENFERSLDTLVTVDLDDFELFSIHNPTSITINSKELKVNLFNKKVLNYGEQLNVSVQISFSEPGLPFVLRYIVNTNVIADFVLSSFQVEEQQVPLQTQKKKPVSSAVFNESIFVNRIDIPAQRKVHEPLPDEDYAAEKRTTLFQEFKLISHEEQQDEEEKEEQDLILPTQFQKKPRTK
jgi:hypothetical protein